MACSRCWETIRDVLGIDRRRRARGRDGDDRRQEVRGSIAPRGGWAFGAKWFPFLGCVRPRADRPRAVLDCAERG